jgi:hypothetical protein
MPSPKHFLQLFLLLATLVVASPCLAVEYFVSPTGNDANNGRSLAAAWRTLGRAVRSSSNAVAAGDVITVKAGTYSGVVTVQKSGTAAAPLTIRAAVGEQVIVSGVGVAVPENFSIGLFRLRNVSYVTLEGLEIRDLAATTNSSVPIGIWIEQGCRGITLRNLKLSNIGHLGDLSTSPDAHGILLSGNSATPISDFLMEGCEVSNLTLGSSEAVAVNGNVDGFVIRNNSVHDVNNIGIDVIGYEGRAPAGSIDRARNGYIVGNLVYNVDSSTNPSYGANPNRPGEYYRAAAGIYIDGGTQCIVEANRVYGCNFGIELASERLAFGVSEPGLCDFITVASNLVHHNHGAGIIMGGYEAARGTTRDCQILNNTLYRNNTISDGEGQLVLQHNVVANSFYNNILVTDSTGVAIRNDLGPLGLGNLLNFNCYFAPSNNLRFVAMNFAFQVQTFSSLNSWKTRANGEAASLSRNPGFVGSVFDVSTPADQYMLQATSFLRNAGDPNYLGTGRIDYFRNGRVAGGRVDMGFHERDDTIVQRQAQTLTVVPLPSSLSFAGLPLTVDLGAVSSSGLPVTVTVESGPASVVGNNLKVSGPGTIRLSYVQEGDSNWQSVYQAYTLVVSANSTVQHGSWLQYTGKADGRYLQAYLSRTSGSFAPAVGRSSQLVFTQGWTKPDATDYATDALPTDVPPGTPETATRLYSGSSYLVDAVNFSGWAGPVVRSRVVTNYAGTSFKELPAAHALRYRTKSGHAIMMLYANGEVRFRGTPPKGVVQLPWGQRINFGSNPQASGSRDLAQVSFLPLRGLVRLEFAGGPTDLRPVASSGFARLYATVYQENWELAGVPLDESSTPLFTLNGPIPPDLTLPYYVHTSPHRTSMGLSSFLNSTSTYFGTPTAVGAIPVSSPDPQITLQRELTQQPWSFSIQQLQRNNTADVTSILLASPWGTPHVNPLPTAAPLDVLGNRVTFRGLPPTDSPSYQIQVGSKVSSRTGQDDGIAFTVSTSPTPLLVKMRSKQPGALAAVWSPWVTVGSIRSIGLGETTLLTPNAGESVTTLLPTFTWTAIPGATAYKLTYKKRGSKTSTSVSLPTNSYIPRTPLKALSDYDWYVTPTNGSKTGLKIAGAFRTY